MTEQEAIEFGKKVIDLGLKDDTQTFCDMAISALEKQIPKKPKFVCGFEYMDIRLGNIVCPTCNCQLSPLKHNKFCKECGQKLKWGD